MIIAKNMPECIIQDYRKLGQIFVNILANAVKFTHEGSIKITIDMLLNQGILYIQAKVRDTGIGIENIDKAG
jgi:signal transduction histidine kinase